MTQTNYYTNWFKHVKPPYVDSYDVKIRDEEGKLKVEKLYWNGKFWAKKYHPSKDTMKTISPSERSYAEKLKQAMVAWRGKAKRLSQNH